MHRIIPIKDLRNTTKISEMCSESSEPIFITKNGYGDMVIMSIDAYEELYAKIDMYNKIQVALEQVKNGEVVDEETATKYFKEKYGL